MRILFTLCTIAALIACRSENSLGEVIEDLDQDGASADVDCDDSDPSVSPLNPELCNGLDDNCNGLVDDGAEPITWYADADGDGFGNDVYTLTDCEQPEGYTAEGGDCDDMDATTSPATEELCNGLDDNCDEQIDDGFDLDGDGVSRCCTPGDYVAYYPQSVPAPITTIEGRLMPRSNGGVWGAPETLLTGTDLRILGYGNMLSSQHSGLDILWADFSVDPITVHTLTCLDGEWQNVQHGLREQSQRSWGDLNNDGHLDYVDYDWGCCHLGVSGSGAGTTFLGDGDGGFTKVQGTTWNVTQTQGQWTGSTVSSMRDWNHDGFADFTFWSVSSGGSSTSTVWYHPGDGTGDFGAPIQLEPLLAAGNSGDMGDIDGDGCMDWVAGANDDTNPRGGIRALLGDCSGGVREQRLLADQSLYANQQATGIYGDGHARLYDADGDGDLDLFTSYNVVHSSGRGPSLYYENDGTGHFPALPSEVITSLSANRYYAGVYVPLGE